MALLIPVALRPVLAVTPDAVAADDFVGSWSDSAGNIVSVDCAAPKRLRATLTNPGGRNIYLALQRDTSSGQWRCGNASLLKRSGATLAWEFADGRISVWTRARAESDTTASDYELDPALLSDEELEDLDSPRSSLDGLRSPCEAWFAGKETCYFAPACDLHPAAAAPPGQWCLPLTSVSMAPAPRPHDVVQHLHEADAAPTESLTADELRGHVWELSRKASTCRQVQQTLAEVDAATAGALACELRGLLWDAMHCPHANYVLQKCITTLHLVPDWIVEEVLSWGKRGVVAMVMHRFGCRIFERLLEHCTESQQGRLAECLLDEIVMLSGDQYANYCIQHVVEFGLPEHRSQVADAMIRNVSSMAADYYAGAVVTKCMEHCSSALQMRLAEAILMHGSWLLERMAHYRFSHCAVIQLLQLQGMAEQTRVALCSSQTELRKSRYGREVLSQLLVMPH